jgi:hypothetical protein
LIAAFARQKQTRPARRLATLWAFAAAAAAVAGIAFLVWPSAPRPVETPVVEVSKPKPPQPVAIVQVAPRPRPRRPAPKAAAIRRRPRSREVMTQFYPLEYVDSAVEQESGPIIRVQVPRSMLVSFGLPIDQDRVFEPVEADVVLDDTGTARAIRFVHTVD